MKICFGLSSGIGNVIFTIPAIKALRLLGHDVTAYVDGDYDMRALLERCVYFSDVIDGKHHDPPIAERYMAGHWCPFGMRNVVQPHHYRWTNEPNYPEPEWSLNMQAARDLGWTGPAPDVSDWCRGLRREIRYDVGIIPGCKPGDIWERKRWPGLAAVSIALRDAGLRCAVIGQPSDDDPAIVGERVGASSLAGLPDVLASCRVIVGTDSGPLHMASSLGVPVAAVFTATNHVKGQPIGPHTSIFRDLHCRPCQSTPVWHLCRAWVCRDIDPANVTNAVFGLLPMQREAVA